MDFHDSIGFLAAGLAVYAYVPYFIGIAKGKTRPHVFTWLLWSMLTGIGGAAQVAAGGGAGTWVILTSSVMCFFVFLFALKRGERNITRSDWASFIAALMALPLWYFTKDPLWSVLLVIAIDAMAFYPTFRKSWNKPHEEVVQSYLLSGIKFALGVIALEQLSLTTALYPAYLTGINFFFVAVLMWRRKVLNL